MWKKAIYNSPFLYNSLRRNKRKLTYLLLISKRKFIKIAKVHPKFMLIGMICILSISVLLALGHSILFKSKPLQHDMEKVTTKSKLPENLLPDFQNAPEKIQEILILQSALEQILDKEKLSPQDSLLILTALERMHSLKP